jgi:hypothetical protein
MAEAPKTDSKKTKIVEVDGTNHTIQWTESAKNVEIILKDVRISFAHLFEVQENKNDKGEVTGHSYGCIGLMDKSTTQGKLNIALCNEAMKRAKSLRWGDRADAPKIPPERRCVRDGEPVDPDTDAKSPLYDGYDGCMFVSANRGVKSKDAKFPGLLLDSRKGADGKFPRLKESDGKLYSGSYADMIVRIYGFDGTAKKVPHRINASLEALKFKRHGEAFGAKQADADNMFDEESEDDLDAGTTTANKKPATADLDDL